MCGVSVSIKPVTPNSSNPGDLTHSPKTDRTVPLGAVSLVSTRVTVALRDKTRSFLHINNSLSHNEGVSKVRERTSERSGAREQGEQGGASEPVSGPSD